MTASGASLLLVGSGRSHLLLLLRAGANPIGVNSQITLVAPDRFALYPALLPELITEQRGYRESHIDLQQLCERAGARLVTSSLAALELESRCAYLSDGQQVQFDLLSFDGDSEWAVKAPKTSLPSLSTTPINRFLPGWQGILERIYLQPKGASLALVGDNETSVELALAIRARLASDPRLKKPTELHLVYGGRSLLPQLPLKAQLLAAQALREQNVRVHPLFPAVRFEEGRLLSERGQHLPADEVIWCQLPTLDLGAQKLGMALGKQGLIKVNRHLQSVSHPFVFASGAWAEFDSRRHTSIRVSAADPKTVLVTNLGRYLRGDALKVYKEPKTPFGFIKLGKDQAMLQHGDTVLTGAWVRRWKNFIDRRFIVQFPRP